MTATPTARELIELPGSFTFKVIMKRKISDQWFLEHTETHLGRPLAEPELRGRPSSKGNYHAYTLTIHIEVYEEIETLYLSYQNLEEVVMVL